MLKSVNNRAGMLSSMDELSTMRTEESSQDQAATRTNARTGSRLTLDSVKTAYRRYAGFYDLLFGPICEPGRRKAIDLVNNRADQRILEVGVGTGLALPMYRSDSTVVGIDLSPEMLRKARARVARKDLANIEALIEMDAEHLEFADSSFDCVFAVYVASVVPNPANLVAEMQRVCVPGGDIVVVNHFASDSGFLSWIEKATTSIAQFIGFKPDFRYDDFVRLSGMELLGNHSASALGIWRVLHFRNAETQLMSVTDSTDDSTSSSDEQASRYA
jgi:phosphatidylethanolamine/phosphatidyl-N-methylethanolamine N-methyltransferase